MPGRPRRAAAPGRRRRVLRRAGAAARPPCPRRAGAPGAAGEEQFGVGDSGQGPDGLVVALAGDQPADGEQPVRRPPLGRPPGPAGRGAAGQDPSGVRPEVVRVDAAGHDRHPAARDTHRGEFADLVAARGQHPVAGAAEAPFHADALGRAGVGRPLVAPLDRAEGVEGLHDRDAVGVRAEPGGDAGHPEVRVHHLGPVPLAGPGAGQVRAEHGHVREEFVLGDRLGRSGRDVLDDGAAGQRHPLGQRGRVAPGVDGDLVAAPGQLLRQARHVHVLASGVGAAERGERARVLGHHGDPHRVTSLNSRSQSSRKRGSP